MYGAHICGEGGEYESLTLDLPLFKHRIRLCVLNSYFPFEVKTQIFQRNRRNCHPFGQ
jgi:diphthamide synthase (EF-2-diphthine--ammonia ligase)